MRLSHHRRPLAYAGRQAGAHRQSGTALVEFALILPLVAMLVAGTFEYGMGWRADLSTGAAARSGARVGSSLGPDQTGDYYILTSVKASMQSSGLLPDVQQVIIFRSDTANGVVPPECLTTSPGTAKCDIVTGDQLRAITSLTQFGTNGCLTAATTKNWCPTTRNNVQVSADYLGVYVQMRRTFMFKMIGSGLTIREVAIMRLEPKED